MYSHVKQHGSGRTLSCFCSFIEIVAMVQMRVRCIVLEAAYKQKMPVWSPSPSIGFKILKPHDFLRFKAQHTTVRSDGAACLQF